MNLNILHKLPDHICDTQVEELHSLLGGPTLFDLRFGKESTLFISTLLHGDEHSGFLALRDILKEIQEKKWAPHHSLLLFLGNTLAAEQNKRHLKDQSDFNRIWNLPLSQHSSPFILMAQEIVSYASQKKLIGSLDIHNSTGENPFYTCLNILEGAYLKLAQLFSQKIVFFKRPLEVQSQAFSKLCPSITIEAGPSREPSGIKLLKEKIKAILQSPFFKDIPHFDQTEFFQTVGRIKWKKEISFDFQFQKDSTSHFSFLSDLDQLNFKSVPVGKVLAYIQKDFSRPFGLEGEGGQDLFEEYFEFQEGTLRVKQSFVPALFSKNEEAIRNDCLGYVMTTISKETVKCLRGDQK